MPNRKILHDIKSLTPGYKFIGGEVSTLKKYGLSKMFDIYDEHWHIAIVNFASGGIRMYISPVNKAKYGKDRVLYKMNYILTILKPLLKEEEFLLIEKAFFNEI